MSEKLKRAEPAEAESADELQHLIADLRANLDEEVAAREMAERELVQLKLMLDEAQHHVAAMGRTLSFRLGSAILDAKTPFEMIRLPVRLLAISRRFKRERAVARAAGRPANRRRDLGPGIGSSSE